MRASLLYNPFDLVERLALASRRRRRRRPLRGTPAAKLRLGHLDSLELLLALRSDPPRVIHDVGANVGTWTCLAKSIFPQAAVEAFEPLEAFGAGFHRWTGGWSDVRLHPLALGATTGNIDLEVTSFSDATSILPLTAEGRTIFALEPAGRQPAQIARLDDLVAAGKVRAPDLIKLDIQGYELEAMKGAEACLHRAHAVICEVSFRRFYQDQALFGEILSYLEKRGYELEAFGEGLIPGQSLVQADALFIKR